MKPAAGSAESKARLLQELGPLKGGGKRGSRCNYRTRTFALTITLAIVSSALVGTVVAVLLFTRCSDLGSCAIPCPGSRAVPYCPEGWVGYGGKCYYFSEEAKDWDASQHFCSSFNASLAGIDTLQEKGFMMRYFGHVEHWIGLRRESGQPWTWVNGTQLKQQLFEGRAEGDCSYLSLGFTRSSGCSSLRNWICSKPDRYL